MKPLAAIVYEPGTGNAVDLLLCEAAGRLAGRGIRLAGTVQRSRPRVDRCACDMLVTDLSSGRQTSISEDRGPMARGCRLDTHALETLVAATEAALADGADLLIVNKFGKREAEGAGFRPVIAAALGEGIPVLVAVNRAQIAAWQAFAADFAETLAPTATAIAAWCDDLLASDAAAVPA